MSELLIFLGLVALFLVGAAAGAPKVRFGPADRHANTVDTTLAVLLFGALAVVGLGVALWVTP